MYTVESGPSREEGLPVCLSFAYLSVEQHGDIFTL